MKLHVRILSDIYESETRFNSATVMSVLKLPCIYKAIKISHLKSLNKYINM